MDSIPISLGCSMFATIVGGLCWMISKNEENKTGGEGNGNVKAAKVTSVDTDSGNPTDKNGMAAAVVATSVSPTDDDVEKTRDASSGKTGYAAANSGDGGTLPEDGGTLPEDGGTLSGNGGTLSGDGGTLSGDGGDDGGTLSEDGGTLPGDGYLVEAKHAVYIGRGKAFDALLKAHYVGIMNTAGEAKKKGFFGSMFSGKKGADDVADKKEADDVADMKGAKEPATGEADALKPTPTNEDAGSDDGQKQKSGFLGKMGNMFKKKGSADGDASDASDNEKPSIWGRLKGEKSLITDGSLKEEKEEAQKDARKPDGGLLGKVGSLFGKKGEKIGGGGRHRTHHKSSRDAAYIKNKIRHKMRQRELAPSSIM
jgi:hypothetical protein